MEYLVKFEFTCMKNFRFEGKSGDVSISTEGPVSVEEIKQSDVVKTMIARDMASKTGKQILGLEITDVTEIN